jgi:alkylated DNA repair protein alkB family protein 6
VIDFAPHGKLSEHEHTYPQTVQSDELQENNGSYKVEDTKEADPASLSLLLMPCSLLIFKDQAYTG